MICSIFVYHFHCIFLSTESLAALQQVRRCARAALPSLRCWEIFGRSPIITPLPVPISVGLRSECWEQTCACCNITGVAGVRKRFGNIYSICLGNLGSCCSVPNGRGARAAPGVQGWQRQGSTPGQMLPHPPPWDKEVRDRRHHQESPTPPHHHLFS